MSDTKDADVAMIDKFADSIGEHFDTVQIFATRYESDGRTVSVARGTGNWFARYGQAKEWITKVEENTRIEERRSDE